jgi:hypothetical protein
MTDTVYISLITALAALIGALIGALPSIFQYRLRQKEVHEQRHSRIHTQTLELIKAYGERIKLLEINPGVYSTHDPPLFLYWTFFRALKEVEEGKTTLPPDIEKLIAQDFKLIGRNPNDYGLNVPDDKQ